jgi:hypothetical protein
MIVLSETIIWIVKDLRKAFHAVVGLSQGRKDSDDDNADSVLNL